MHVIDLITSRPVVWGLFLVYVGMLAALAALGRRKARGDAASFAVGKKMNPIVAGMTLSASIASTATFVINPGFIYAHGISALLHFGVAASAGMALGLVLVCGRFRRRGAAGGALTLPQWIGQRYGSRALRGYFAAVNLLSLAFVVLILGGLAIVMQATLGLSYRTSLLAVTVIVVGYVLAGGAYANAYVNTLQAAIMAIVAAMIVGSGLHHFADPGAALDRLAAIDANLTAAVNPASSLFGNWYSVFGAGFVIGFALMCQPHVMTTALYVEDDRGIRRALAVAIGLGVLFSGVLLAGLYAHLDGIGRDAIVDPATGAFRQDQVMAVYLSRTFSSGGLALVTIAILAAGMSTMSSILVALSGITGNDLFPLLRRGTEPVPLATKQRVGQLSVLLFSFAAFAIALDPPQLLGIFGQLGAYGVVSAAAAPLILGALIPTLPRRAALAAALLGPSLHFGLYFLTALSNPAVTSSLAILASTLVALALHRRATVDAVP